LLDNSARPVECVLHTLHGLTCLFTHFLVAALLFRYIFKQGHADAWLHLYTNGKSAVRPDAPGVTQGGAHVFLGPADKRCANYLHSDGS
jgi:hypothetical protein